MATSRKTSKKNAPVHRFPAPSTSTAVIDDAIPEEFSDSESTTELEPGQDPALDSVETIAPAPKEKGKPGRPTNQSKDFWTIVNRIPRSEWGTNVYLYLYVLEPLCNLKQSGGTSYLNRYSSPVRDEHEIVNEYGSGRYRLMLSQRKDSNQADGVCLARHEFEAYNPKYPPKIPTAAWVKDDRNQKWLALLPKEQPAAAVSSPVDLVGAIKVVNDIRSQVRDEIEDNYNPDQSQSPNDTLQLLKTAKELFAPAATAPAAAPTVQKDPLEIALQLFTLMNTSKAENPVIDMYKLQLEMMNKQMEQLQKQLLEVKKEEKPKTLVEQIKELAGMGDQLKPIKEMLGLNGDGPARHGKMNTLEFISNFADTQMGAALGAGLSNLALAFMSRPAPGMVPPGPQIVPPPTPIAQPANGNGAPETAQDRLRRIGQTITQPMLYEFFFPGESGQTFAASMCNMFESDYMFLKELGPARLVDAYRQFPPAWQVIQPKEIEFIKFVEEFCSFDPNVDEAPAPGPGTADDGIVDYDQQEGN